MSDYICLENCTTDPFWTEPGVDKRVKERNKELFAWKVEELIGLGFSKRNVAKALGVNLSAVYSSIREKKEGNR